MRGKAFIPLLLGLGVGLLAVKFGVDAVKKARGSGSSQTTVQVVRAKLDIDAHEAITAEMVELIETVDTSFIPQNDRIGSLEDVVGRVSAKNIPMQSPVLASMLTPPGTPPGMVGRIPPGYRAVAVRIDEVTGVAFQVKPGDYVDVIVVIDVSTGKNRARKETIAEVILQRVRVAAIGQQTRDAAAGRSAKVRPAKSATLFVAEEDVPKLHLAATRGKVTLAMRGAEDVKTTDEFLRAKASDVFAALRDQPPEKPAPKIAPPLPIPRPEPQVIIQPHSVIVQRGTVWMGLGPTIERLMFADAASTNIINVTDSAAQATVATLKTGSRRSPAVPRQPARVEPDADSGSTTDPDSDGE